MHTNLTPIMLTTPIQPPDPQQLQELQHFAELGRLSASLLHEISNPLTAAILELDQSDRLSVRQARRSLQVLRRYVEAARQQVQQQSFLKSFAVQRQLDQLKLVLRPLARAAGVTLLIQPAPRCRLYGDPVKFQQVIANLVTNAIDAYRDDSTRQHKPVCVQLQLGINSLTIRIIDWGAGIASDQLPFLFEPFYSTKQAAGHGLGLGLYIVQQYVSLDFGGSLSVSSSRRHGTQFTLKLPLA